MTNSPTVTVSSNTYVVQKGDILSKIGQKTGVAWKKIAELNGIKFPYVVKVGQVLKLSNSTTTTTAKPTTSTSTTTSTTSKGYIYNGVDYSLVFNPTYYANSYSDLKRHFGTDATKLFQHYINFGIQEGRQAISTFNVKIYKLSNPDLQAAFGEKDGYKPYVLHYLQYGHKENRKTV
jgi:murein DD-endopeptidase MepM/ murein hydrolase activator NlpD